MPAGTVRQVEVWQLHKDICQNLSIGQSTLRHKSLAGSLDVASSTGVRVYVPPKATSAIETTSDTAVWCVWQEMTRGSGSGGGSEATEAGRVGVPTLKGQFPAVDDSGNVITVSHDDWIQDANGVLYRILNPVISTDLGYWSFQVLAQR